MPITTGVGSYQARAAYAAAQSAYQTAVNTPITASTSPFAPVNPAESHYETVFTPAGGQQVTVSPSGVSPAVSPP